MTDDRRHSSSAMSSDEAPAEGRDSAISVMIVDDHSITRTGLRTVIAAQPDMTVAGEAALAREASDLAPRVCRFPMDSTSASMREPQRDKRWITFTYTSFPATAATCPIPGEASATSSQPNATT